RDRPPGSGSTRGPAGCRPGAAFPCGCRGRRRRCRWDRSYSSRGPLRDGPERPVLREIRVVVEARDLEAIEEDSAGLDRGALVRLALPLERDEANGVDALDCERGLHEGAQVDGLAEAEAVRVEEAQRAVGAHAVREHVEERLLDVGAEVAALHADGELDLERDVVWVVDLEVVAGETELLEVIADLRLEARIEVHGI